MLPVFTFIILFLLAVYSIHYNFYSAGPPGSNIQSSLGHKYFISKLPTYYFISPSTLHFTYCNLVDKLNQAPGNERVLG